MSSLNALLEKVLGFKVTLSMTGRWVTHINSWSAFDKTQKKATRSYLQDGFVFLSWISGVCWLHSKCVPRRQIYGDLYSFLEDWTHTGRRRQGLYGPAWIKTDNGPWVQATHGRGEVIYQDGNNRNVLLTDDRRRLWITIGGLALTERSLAPYTCDASSILPVLALNPLPDRDGAPARVQWLLWCWLLGKGVKWTCLTSNRTSVINFQKMIINTK